MISAELQTFKALALLTFLTLSNSSSQDGPLLAVPLSDLDPAHFERVIVAPDSIDFLLYSNRSNPDTFQVLTYQNLTSVTSSSFDPSKPTKFLVHGFQNNRNATFPQNAKNAYLKHPADHNIIIVDWGKLAIPTLPFDYPEAVRNIGTAGMRLGNFIVWLKSNCLIDLTTTHLVGFSLGAHVSGRAGSVVLTSLNEPLARITALDPAGPAFYTGIFARRLQPIDATYVDAYHTDIFRTGHPAMVGWSDVFINGGLAPQPGCLLIDLSCSHVYATKFWSNTIGTTASVRPQDDALCASATQATYWFERKCDKKIRVGEHASLKTATFGESYVTYNVSFT